MIGQSWYNDDIAERFEPFVKTAKKKGVCIFAGAGISVPPPSSCPTWDTLKREILNALSARLSSVRNIKKDVEELSNLDMRPELFMTCMTAMFERGFVVEMVCGLNSGEPNLNHSLIALLAREQIVRSIITTNFDNYLERELDSSWVNSRVIRDDDEVPAGYTPSGNPLPVFKPHGCLSKPSSLRMRLNEIQILSDSKKNLLQQLTYGIPLLIMGYSGNDEDFFPVLEESIHNNPTETCIVVYPGSRPSEPIQQLNMSRHKMLQIIISDPMDVLQMLASRLVPAKQMASYSSGDRHRRDRQADWRENILQQANLVPPGSAAACIAHIVHTWGNYHLCLRFVEIARHFPDGCAGPVHAFLETAEARALKELGRFEDANKILSDDAS